MTDFSISSVKGDYVYPFLAEVFTCQLYVFPSCIFQPWRLVLGERKHGVDPQLTKEARVTGGGNKLVLV